MSNNDNTLTKEKVLDILNSNDKAVERAILALYERQTSNEKNTFSSDEHNGVGFNKYDAKFLSSLAEYLIRNPNRGLTAKQLAAVRKVYPNQSNSVIGKYYNQLIQIAKEKAERNTGQA